MGQMAPNLICSEYFRADADGGGRQVLYRKREGFHPQPETMQLT